MTAKNSSSDSLIQRTLDSVKTEAPIRNGGGHPLLIKSIEAIQSLNTEDDQILYIGHNIGHTLRDGTIKLTPGGVVVAVTEEFIYAAYIDEDSDVHVQTHAMRLKELTAYFIEEGEIDIRAHLKDGTDFRFPFGPHPTPRSYRDARALIPILKRRLD